MSRSAMALGQRQYHSARAVATEPKLAKYLLISGALLFVGLFSILPLAVVMTSALADGWGAYRAALGEPDTLAALRLTLLTAAIAVPLNVVFGVAAAWLLSKYDFFGKQALLTLVDLPFSVSPVVAGLIFVLLFGKQGWFGAALTKLDWSVLFAVPGVVIATTFVTFPFVAREVLEVMRAQGHEEEEAALVLGASAWQIIRRVTLPKVKWGVVYGAILCNARAMGEFGAVSVVSGHVRGETNTLPLHVEILYGDYHFAAAFAVASLLAVLALATLVVKSVLEWRLGVTQRAMEGTEPRFAAAETGVVT